jgi:hypothetical protein
MDPSIPCKGNVWCFEALFMALDTSKIYLGPNTWPFSLDHFQGPETHTYYSKPPSGTNIKVSIFLNCSQYLYFSHYFCIGYTNPLLMKLNTHIDSTMSISNIHLKIYKYCSLFLIHFCRILKYINLLFLL